MRRLESILFGVAIIGMVLKWFRVPGNGLILILGISILCLIYFPFGFALFNRIRLRHIFKKNSYQNKNALRFVGAAGAGISLTLLLTGILFKIQLWPGAKFQLMVGLVYVSLVAAVALILHFLKRADFYRGILKRTAIIGGFGLFFLFLPSTVLVEIYYRDDPQYMEMYKRALAHPQDEEIQRQFQKLQEQRSGGERQSE